MISRAFVSSWRMLDFLLFFAASSLIFCRLICWLSRFFSGGRLLLRHEDESWNSIMTNESGRAEKRKFVFCYGITTQRLAESNQFFIFPVWMREFFFSFIRSRRRRNFHQFNEKLLVGSNERFCVLHRESFPSAGWAADDKWMRERSERTNFDLLVVQVRRLWLVQEVLVRVFFQHNKRS